MFIIKYLILLFVLGSGQKVKELDDESFGAFIKNNPEAVVLFYMNSCEHSHKFIPEFEYTAAHFPGDVKFGKIDITASGVTGRDEDINKTPTTKLYRKDEDPVVYEFAKHSSALTKWLNKMTGELVKVVEDSTVRPVLNQAVFVLHGNYGEDLLKKYKDVAKTFRSKYLFKRVEPDKEAITAKIVAVGEDTYGAELTVDNDTDLKQLVRIYSLPLIGKMTEESIQRLTEPGLDMCWLLADPKDQDKLIPHLVEVVPKYREDCIWATVNLEREGRFAKHILGTFENPVIARTFGGAGRYKLNLVTVAIDQIASTVDMFMDNIRHGRIKPHMNSEDEREGDLDKPVARVVGTNIDKFLDSHDNVILFVDGPHCRHCKLFSKYILTNIVPVLGGVDDLAFGAYEAVTNESGRLKLGVLPGFYTKKGGSDKLEYFEIEISLPRQFDADIETLEEYWSRVFVIKEAELDRIIKRLADIFGVKPTPYKPKFDLDPADFPPKDHALDEFEDNHYNEDDGHKTETQGTHDEL